MPDVPAHHRTLVDDIRTMFAAGRLPPEWVYCNVFWRSHGCDLNQGHQLPHLCVCDLSRPNWELPDPPAGVDIPLPHDFLFDMFGRPVDTHGRPLRGDQ